MSRIVLPAGEEEMLYLLWRLGVLTAEQATRLYRDGSGCGVRYAQRMLSGLEGGGLSESRRRSPRWETPGAGPRPLCHTLTERGIAYAGRYFDDMKPNLARKTYGQVYGEIRCDHALLRNEYLALVAGDARRITDEGTIRIWMGDLCAEPLAWRAVYPKREKRRRGWISPDGSFRLSLEGSSDYEPEDRTVIVEAHTGTQDTRAAIGGKIERYCGEYTVVNRYLNRDFYRDPLSKMAPRVVFVCPDAKTKTIARRLALTYDYLAYSPYKNLLSQKNPVEPISDLILFTSLEELRSKDPLGRAYSPLDDTDDRLLLI